MSGIDLRPHGRLFVWVLFLLIGETAATPYFVAGTRLLDRRPGLAGLAFGALIFKPHLGLLIPLALLAERHFRAIAAAAAAAAAAGGLILLSWLLFGTAAWAAFLPAFAGSFATFATDRIELAGRITVFAAARLLGVPAAPAYAAQGLAGTAAGMAMLFRRRAPLPLRAASLLAATLLATPVLLLYDLMLLALALAWLLVDARERGLQPGQAPTLVAGYLTPLLCRPIGLALNLGITPVAAVAVLVSAIQRSRDRCRCREPGNSVRAHSIDGLTRRG
jgi:hypothetical protein